MAKIDYTEPEREAKPLPNRTRFCLGRGRFSEGAKVEANGDRGAAVVEGGQVLQRQTRHRAHGQGLAQDVFTEASQPLMVGKDDKLFAYVYLDPANPPKAIMLQFHTSDWLHRANWGDEDAIPSATKARRRNC